jgi:hypothetical protein
MKISEAYEALEKGLKVTHPFLKNGCYYVMKKQNGSTYVVMVFEEKELSLKERVQNEVSNTIEIIEVINLLSLKVDRLRLKLIDLREACE